MTQLNTSVLSFREEPTIDLDKVIKSFINDLDKINEINEVIYI